MQTVCSGCRKHFHTPLGYRQHRDSTASEHCSKSESYIVQFTQDKWQRVDNGADQGKARQHTGGSSRTEACDAGPSPPSTHAGGSPCPGDDDPAMHCDDDGEVVGNGEGAANHSSSEAESGSETYSKWEPSDWAKYAETQWSGLSEDERVDAVSRGMGVWEEAAFKACMVEVQRPTTQLLPHEWTVFMMAEWDRRGALGGILNNSCQRLQQEACMMVESKVARRGIPKHDHPYSYMLTKGAGMKERLQGGQLRASEQSSDSVMMDAGSSAFPELPVVDGMKPAGVVFKNWSTAVTANLLCRLDVSVKGISKILKLFAHSKFDPKEVRAETAETLFKHLVDADINVQVHRVNFTQPCDRKPVFMYHVDVLKAVTQVRVPAHPLIKS